MIEKEVTIQAKNPGRLSTKFSVHVENISQ